MSDPIANSFLANTDDIYQSFIYSPTDALVSCL